ncbi:LysR family transcriptional regulator [Alphaproteobacteria bacterium GH1-50]|uniref:LysR family transcriptional regulator n=1 Tax=Kangsaoukella pontilimi TaxID=2691042 RepID=A0A7C9IIM4_9RHOB|nr:LysR family transcriptional regulator [Kangsaoukella pontilimi]MXQ09844.1 LysR family transcriptional regulator [Kangsaoukella pontilimi]
MDRLLRQFLAVAEMGNVSLAAQAMNVSQPTVSVNMRKLEQQHGVPLFQRSSRGVILTEYGQILYEHVRVMARLDAHATAEIRARREIDRPTLKVATGFAWWPVAIREAVMAFRAEFPDTNLHVEICSSFDGLRYLLSGDAHVFFGSKVAAISGGLSFDFEKLFDVEDAYFARAGHPLSGREVERSDLAGYPRLDVAPVVNRHLGLVETPEAAPEPDWSHPLRAPLSTNSVTAGIELLRDSDAYLVYPVAVRPEFARRGVEMLNVRNRPRDRVDIGIYTLTEMSENSLVSAFLDRLRNRDWSLT